MFYQLLHINDLLLDSNQMLLQRGVAWKTYMSGCQQHEAAQNQSVRKLSNCLWGVLNDFGQFSLFACTFCLHILLAHFACTNLIWDLSPEVSFVIFTCYSSSEQIINKVIVMYDEMLFYV